MKKPANDTLGYIFIILYFVGLIGFFGGIIISSSALFIISVIFLAVDFILCNHRVWNKMVQRQGPTPSKFPTHLLKTAPTPLWVDILLNIGLALMIGILIKYLP